MAKKVKINVPDGTVVLDVETTGLIKPGAAQIEEQPKIIEFAAVKYKKGIIDSRLEFLCDPKMSLPAIITKITGIRDADLKGKKTFKQHSKSLAKFLSDASWVVAHNAKFDWGVIGFEFERLEMDIPKIDKLVCTVEATYAIQGFRLSLEKLYNLAHDKPLPEGAHRAMNDVEFLASCLPYLLKEEYI